MTQSDMGQIPMETPEAQESSWAFLQFAWRRKWIVLFLTGVGIGLGYLFFLRQAPVYQSVAQVLIVRRQTYMPLEGLKVQLGYDSTHEILIRSPKVAELALKSAGSDLMSLPTIRDSGNPAGVILSGLTVQKQVNNGQSGDVLELSYAGPHADDCPKILAAVIAGYQRFLSDTYKDVSDEATVLITNAKDQLEKDLQDEEKKYLEFRKHSELLFNGETGQSIHDARVRNAESIRAECNMQILQLKAQIDSIEGSLQRGVSREALNLMVTREREIGNQVVTNRRDGTRSVDDQLFPLLVEEQALLTKYGADHPEVRNLRKRIDMTRKHLLGVAEKEKVDDVTPVDFYQVYLESLREEIRHKNQYIAEVDRMFEQEQAAAQKLTNDQIKNQMHRASIDRKQRLFDSILQKLEEISLIKSSGGVVFQEVHPPGPAYQTKPDIRQILISAGLLGFLAGLGLAFAVDTADRRFRSPDEIRALLRTPVIGHIPVIQEAVGSRRSRAKSLGLNESPISTSLRTFHHPKGRIAEAYRAVRTALYFSTRGSGHQVIQVTSPSPGDGKTTSAANLAVAIAQSGKSVLLIDADFRRPRCHLLFGVDNSVGMSSVIAGSLELDDAIQPTAVENLSIMPCGPKPANPAELLSSTRFEELVNVLREKFDLVIIDSPPVLAVTDPLNVAPRVDGVLLVLRLTKSARSAGTRALDALDGMGVNVLGVVVNGVGESQGYGGYSYGGYGRAYAYSYNYYDYGQYGESRYGNSENSYYADDDEPNSPPVVRPNANGNGKNPH